MGGARTARTGVLVTLLSGALLLLALTPAAALASWTGAQASIVDPHGTGVVPLLNVSVTNHAVNDAAAVTTVQFSEDGQDWYAVPYTGQPCAWVLGGESGHKILLVRFAAADGSLSPVVSAGITVDTAGPVTSAGSVTRGQRGPQRLPVRRPRRRLDARVRHHRGARTRGHAPLRARHDPHGERQGPLEAQAPAGVIPVARAGDGPRRLGAGPAGSRSVHDQVTRPPL